MDLGKSLKVTEGYKKQMKEETPWNAGRDVPHVVLPYPYHHRFPACLKANLLECDASN
jgi:hypothetical protein